MRVGLDLLYLIPGETGGREGYARELVPALLEQDPGLELVAFVNRDAGPQFGSGLAASVRTVVLPLSAHSRAQWAAGELALVTFAARRERVELLHSMANFAPFAGPFKRVVTIHDLQYMAVPELLSAPTRMATHALVSLAARRATRVIAVSAAGREEIVGSLPVDSADVDVVPNGVRPAPQAVDSRRARERHNLGEGPLLLAVATNLPHKNLPVLFPALARFPVEQRPLLVLAGHGTDGPSLMDAARGAGVEPDVRLLGALTTAELEDLYAAASCLVMPSLHEGFGLPVLEAMARGVPVACSNIPALNEVGADAVLYFDPRRPGEIARRLMQLLDDAPLAERLRALGHAQAQQFSWAEAARGTLASYRRAATS
jgi:glycosyltransferase involved in cell wall biosynthesis